MQSFDTYNQFDKRFSNVAKFGADRSACPLFGLITCYNFMLNGDISQIQHELNLQSAVQNYTTKKSLPKYMSFDELSVLTNTFKPKDINATNPELLTSNIVGYEHIFKFGHAQRYCVLFLKNRNFIAVLYTSGVNETYAIRDCHETTQRTFNNFEDLRVFLNNTYQFEQQTIVGGVRIAEFENIEYITIDIPFDLINIDIFPNEPVAHNNIPDEVYKQKGLIIPNSNSIKIGDDLDQYIALSLECAFDEDDCLNFV